MSFIRAISSTLITTVCICSDQSFIDAVYMRVFTSWKHLLYAVHTLLLNTLFSWETNVSFDSLKSFIISPLSFHHPPPLPSAFHLSSSLHLAEGFSHPPPTPFYLPPPPLHPLICAAPPLCFTEELHICSPPSLPRLSLALSFVCCETITCRSQGARLSFGCSESERQRRTKRRSQRRRCILWQLHLHGWGGEATVSSASP